MVFVVFFCGCVVGWCVEGGWKFVDYVIGCVEDDCWVGGDFWCEVVWVWLVWCVVDLWSVIVYVVCECVCVGVVLGCWVVGVWGWGCCCDVGNWYIVDCCGFVCVGFDEGVDCVLVVYCCVDCDGCECWVVWVFEIWCDWMCDWLVVGVGVNDWVCVWVVV